MFNSQDQLTIFENFRVDHTLPKYAGPAQGSDDMNENMSEEEFSVLQSALVVNSNRRGNFSIKANSWSGAPGWWRRFCGFFRRLFGRWEEQKHERRAMSIEAFFRSVKNGTEELAIVDQRARGYETALLRAKETGQVALFEQLAQGLQATRAEAQLVALGLPRYLDEGRLVEFVKKAKRGLRLDWMANFTRTVPSEVLAQKKRADERGAFDNYVILHYDPQAKSWAETQEEKERRKDPILFGLIEGRRRLYFVGDWKDEFCDLTLDQVADVLGKDAIGQVE